MDRGERIGAVLRSRTRQSLYLFLSVIDLVWKRQLQPKYQLPETTRLADILDSNCGPMLTVTPPAKDIEKQMELF